MDSFLYHRSRTIEKLMEIFFFLCVLAPLCVRLFTFFNAGWLKILIIFPSSHFIRPYYSSIEVIARAELCFFHHHMCVVFLIFSLELSSLYICCMQFINLFQSLTLLASRNCIFVLRWLLSLLLRCNALE